MEPKTCAQINLDNLALNIGAIRSKVSPARVIPVVKADGYGHGAVAVTRRLVREGYEFFAVAHFQEAMELRQSGIAAPILIFGRVFPADIPEAAEAGFRITLFAKEDINWIERAGPEKPVHVHVNLDTGMGRMGVLPEQAPDFFNALIRSRFCRWEGLYSHFATAHEKDKAYAHLQLSRFQTQLAWIRKMKSPPLIIHMANSGAVLDLPDSYYDAVRPGILLYGHYPSPETSRSIIPRPVMTLKTYVAQVRNLPAESPVSYGRRWTTPKPTQIAVLPIGYADGIRCGLTNQGEVLIRGRRYPMVGAVTMDHILVDVGDDPITSGDEVVLWGESDQGNLSLLEIAGKLGTIPYELTCGVSKRIKRVYIENS